MFIERPISKAAFNQAALDWIDNLSVNLQQGYVLAIDYGYSGDDFQRGVQVRAQHRHLDSPFHEIGHADITTHVDWRSIARRAEANGLCVAGFTDQHHFLTGIISELGRGGSAEPPAADWSEVPLHDSPKTKRALQTLLHPEMLGRAFQVLVLKNNVGATAPGLADHCLEPSDCLGSQVFWRSGAALPTGSTGPGNARSIPPVDLWTTRLRRIQTLSRHDSLHGVSVLIIALRISRSLRMVATKATLCSLPLARKRS